MNFKEEMSLRTAEIERILDSFLPEETGYARTVKEAANYSIKVGGKRLRPLFMMEVYKLMGTSHPCLPAFMAAIEMIHTYSLVHDDLPAMDNDLYRRGKKTTHAVYGEAMAILAGDALLNYAFETAAGSLALAENEAQLRSAAKALHVLAVKAGIHGMIGGQTADIEAEDAQDGVTEDLLLYIHEHKTAALFQAAMMAGAILGGADEETAAKIEKCGYNLGIAFQIQDDILDVTGSMEELGKPIGSDEKNHKLTYVTMHGLEASAQKVKALSEEAVRILDSFENSNAFLTELVGRLIDRRN